MIFIKTYEGLFSKKNEIPKELIDRIKSNIETKYKVSVDRLKDPEGPVFDRVTFSSTTPIGIVTITIYLMDKHMGSKSLFSKKILKFSTNHGNTQFMSTQVDFEDWESCFKSVVSNIDYAINQVNSGKDEERKYKEFYNKISNNDIKDLVSDISDTMGDYEIERTTIGSKKGFKLTFNIDIKYLAPINVILRSGDFHKATDEYINIITELNTITKRCNDLYDIDLVYKLEGNKLCILLHEK